MSVGTASLGATDRAREYKAVVRSVADAHYDIVIARASPFSAIPEPDLTWERQAALSRGAWVPEEPIVLRRNSTARKPHDLFHGGWPDLYLASNAMLAAVREAELTGWSTWPARVLDTGGSSVGDHTGLAITGRCGPIDPALSRPTPGNEFTMTGKHFAPGTWDGSDLFFPDDGGGLFCTARARDALLAAGIGGLEFVPLSEAEWARGTF